MVADVDRSRAFYGDVVGWDFSEPVAEFGGYLSALVRGRQVAGLSPTMPGMEQAPHVWSVYLATDDIEATAQVALAAGAQQIAEPMQVGPLGSMGMWLDPTGAAFGAWQPGQHTGFDVVDEDGAVAWCDLITSGYPSARTFYAAVFGYTYEEIGMEGMTYSMFTVPGGDRPAGGIGAVNAGDPTGWSVCFQVADVDTAAARIAPAGGLVVREPHDFAFGRLVVASGPDGEPFSLMTPGPQESPA